MLFRSTICFAVGKWSFNKESELKCLIIKSFTFFTSLLLYGWTLYLYLKSMSKGKYKKM